MDRKYLKLTCEQRQYLEEIFPKYNYDDMAEVFNQRFPDNPITRQQCVSYKKNHKLKSGCVGGGKFQKGHIPFNKGKSWNEYIPKESQEKIKKTWFKKGHSKNIKDIGSIRQTKDGYWEIKIAAKGRWKLLQRYIWEIHNGPIPPGHKIIFLDGDRNNCNIDNLALVTYGELSSMNSKGWSYPNKDIKQLYLNILRLENEQKRLKENGKNED